MNKKEPQKIPLTDNPRCKTVKTIPLKPAHEKDFYIRPDNDSIYVPIKKTQD